MWETNTTAARQQHNGPTLLAADRGSLNRADVPLIETETLFRQTEPSLTLADP